MACTIDFRNLDEGFGGKTYKRKRESQTLTTPNNVSLTTPPIAAMEIDLNQPAPKRQAVSTSENPDKPTTLGNATYDGAITGKVSGRNWKASRQRASARNVSKKGTTYEERERERRVKKAYRERKEELKEEIRKNKEEKRKKREEREKKKQENVFKSGTKFQVVSNPKTIKKIAKSKQKKKLLKVVPEQLVNKTKK